MGLTDSQTKFLLVSLLFFLGDNISVRPVSHTIFLYTILRQKDMILGNRFLLTNQGKFLTQGMLSFSRAYLGQVLKPMAQNYQTSQCLFIFLS